MGKLVFDKADLAVVQLASDAFTAASLDEILATARLAREECERQKRVVQWLTIIDDQSEAPNAVDRKRIMDMVMLIPRLHSAMVVTSTFHRTILTAFSWIRPALPGHRYGNFASEQDAIRWLEDSEGRRASWALLIGEARRPSEHLATP